MAYTPGTITGTFQSPDGQPRAGVAYIRLQVPEVRDQEGKVIFAGTVSIDLDEAGSFSTEVTPSDDETLDPSGATYLAEIHFSDGGTPKRVPYISVPSGDTIDISNVGTLDPSAPTYQQWVNEAELAATAAAEAAATATAAVGDVIESATTAVTASQTAITASTTALSAQEAAEAAQASAETASEAAAGAVAPLAADIAAVEQSVTAVEQSVATVEADVATVETNVATVSDRVDTLRPQAASWPIYLYGASYSTLNQAFFTAGRHWAQLLATRAGAGAVTSYGVNGRRALDVALTLLNGVPISGISGIIAAGKWPGTSARSGLVIHDALGNDVMAQAAMNGGSVVVQAITGAPGTTYLNYLKQTYRAALAFMSSESRLENHTHTATSGTWTHSSAGTWASGGDICFTTNAAAWAEYPVTPPQHGPLAGVVWVILDGDIPTANTPADVSVSVDGGTGVVHSTYRTTYTGTNGTQVKGYVNAVPVTVPVDGAAHTVRVTHAGTEGHYMTIDCIVVPSTTPNPILCMGTELPPTVHASALDAGDLVIYKANLIKVTATYKQVIAEFPNAVYVPSTMTANGLWSGDGLHPNDRGQEQREADAWAAVRAIKPRLDSRALALRSDAEFGVV